MNNLYELTYESIQNKYDSGEISYEEALELNDEAYNTLYEGSNIDLLKLYNDSVKDAGKSLKEAKKLMNKKKYKEAIPAFKDTIEKSQKIKEYVKDADDTTLEKIIGSFAFLWKSYLFDIMELSSYAVGGLASKKVLKDVAKLGPAPKKLDTFMMKDHFNWNTKEWELSEASLKKIAENNSKIAKYESEVMGVMKKNKLFTALGGIFTGIGLVMSIGRFISLVIDSSKAMEGAKKMLEKDMDKEHWDRMVTKTYNPLRAYIYQICDEYIIIAKRCIKKIEAFNEKDLDNKEEVTIAKEDYSEISKFFDESEFTIEEVIDLYPSSGLDYLG